MQTEIVVTQDDIIRGYSGSASECPIALATMRAIRHNPAFTEWHNPQVNVGSIILHHRGDSSRLLEYKLPSYAGDFVRKYDKYGTIAVGPIVITAYFQERYMGKWEHSYYPQFNSVYIPSESQKKYFDGLVYKGIDWVKDGVPEKKQEPELVGV